jgi:hypothetical protein
MWLWSAAAWAAPVGFWHPDDVMPLSERFATTSEQLQGPFEQQSDTLGQVARALREYHEGLDLLGARAPAGERERLDGLEHVFQREQASLQGFADRLVEDYDGLFRAAVGRAIASQGDVAECPATVKTGPALPGVPGREKPNPDCVGKNLNAEIAAAIDRDPALKSALDTLLARPWPSVTVSAAPQAAVGGGERWVSVRALIASGAGAQLRTIDREDDEARMEIEAQIEAGASVEALRALEPKAAAIEAETAAKRAAVAAPVLTAAEALMAKRWIGEPSTGWCANPALLGGCSGTDATRASIDRLRADKKVMKAFPPS